MGKSFAIAALVILLLSLPIPVFGNYLTLLAVLLLSVAAYQGERVWTLTVDIVAWVKMFLLSPSWHLLMFGGGYARAINHELEASGAMDGGTRAAMAFGSRGASSSGAVTLLITLAILGAPLAIMWWRSRLQTKPATGSNSGGR